MRLRHPIVALVLLLAGVVLTACQKSKLETGIEEANKQCPISLGALGEVKSITDEGGNMVMTFSVDDDIISVKAMKDNHELMHATALKMMQQAEAELKEIVALMKEEGADLILRYEGKKSHISCEVVLTPAELEAEQEEPGSPLEMLTAQIEVTNIQMPMEVGQGIIAMPLRLEGDYVVYTYKLDETLNSIQGIRDNSEAARENIRQSIIQGSDPSVAAFAALCKEAGKGMMFRYEGVPSGDEVCIEFRANEL